MLSQKVSQKLHQLCAAIQNSEDLNQTATNTYNIEKKVLMGNPPTLQSSELYRISAIMNATEIKTASSSVCITPNDLKRHTAAVVRICNRRA
jgi:hypothetical protein